MNVTNSVEISFAKRFFGITLAISAIVMSGCSSNSFMPLIDAVGTWTAASSYGFTPRYGLSAAVLNGKIYVFGGVDSTLTATNVLEVFDPATNTWNSPVTTGRPSVRSYHTASVVNGKMYIIGGSTFANGTYTFIPTVDVFDPATNGWTTPRTTGTFTPRSGPTASVVNNKIYVIGGVDNNGPLDTVEIFDPTFDVWSTPTTRGYFAPRFHSNSITVGDSIYVFGGEPVGNSDVSIFNAETNVWTNPAMTGYFTPRYDMISELVNDKVYVIGGVTTSVNSVESFDLSSYIWAAPPWTGIFTPRNSMASSEINGHIYVMDGWDGQSATNKNEVYAPAP